MIWHPLFEHVGGRLHFVLRQAGVLPWYLPAAVCAASAGTIREWLRFPSGQSLVSLAQQAWSVRRRGAWKRVIDWKPHVLRVVRFCIMLWKDAPEPTIKNCLGRQVDVVQVVITIQSFGHNRW